MEEGERFEDVTLLTLKIEKGVMVQGMRVLLEAEQGEGKDYPQSSQKEQPS